MVLLILELSRNVPESYILLQIRQEATDAIPGVGRKTASQTETLVQDIQR